MTELSSSEARDAFADIINRAAYGKERVVLTRRGKKLVAVVPVEDLERLEALEDKLDVAAAERAEKRAKAKGEKPIPWDKAKKKLGL
ncbi:MAG: type II toxin-antitoxin system Phd/YefM family antitoxin [Myxococcales bacterium]|nr:type II toxin-antitoxin system Phd/YefM family antitoxin [Myxococcales bacterium]